MLEAQLKTAAGLKQNLYIYVTIAITVTDDRLSRTNYRTAVYPHASTNMSEHMVTVSFIFFLNLLLS